MNSFYVYPFIGPFTFTAKTTNPSHDIKKLHDWFISQGNKEGMLVNYVGSFNNKATLFSFK